MQVEVPMGPLLPEKDLATEVFTTVRESPQIRGWKSQITAGFLIAVLLISGILVNVYVPDEECGAPNTNLTTKCEKQDSGIVQGGIGVSLYLGLVVFFAELLRRFCLLVEEVSHVKTRYNGQYGQVLRQVFLANWNRAQLYITAAAVFTLLAILCFVETTVWLEVRNNFDFALLFMAFYLLFVGLLQVNMSPVDVDTSLEKLPPSPAQGLACSHFYGYVKLLFMEITRANNEVEDWESRLIKYESERNIKVVRKLFILVPDSCDISRRLEAFGLTPLKKISSEAYDMVTSQMERAGRLALYPVAVYKLEGKNGQDDLYVMVDVPRTLVTLKDMNNSGQLVYSLNDEQLASQAIDFKRTLDNIIRDDRDFKKKGYADVIDVLCLKDTGEESTAWANGQLAQLIRNRIK